LYYADDGHLYPGLGYAQWTAGRAKGLLDFCKENNLDWKTPLAQLAWANEELNGDYASALAATNEADTPESAAYAFSRYYEGCKESWIPTRQTNARTLFDQYAGLFDTSGKTREEVKNEYPDIQYEGLDEGIGGPSESSITNTNVVKTTPTSSSTYSLKSSNSKIDGIGGPVDDTDTTSDSDYSISHSTYIPPTTAATPTSSSSDNSVNLDEVVTLLKGILTSLTGIDDNTKTSSTLLDSLNNKDYGTQTSSSSTTSSRSYTKSYSSSSSSSGTSARTIAAMARP
jgi:hypothetical protein